MRLANLFNFMMRLTILLLAFAFVLSAFGFSEAFAAKKIALVEDFTNTRCPPCYTFQPYFDASIEDYVEGEDYVLLAIHVWWPGNDDPWYVNNPNLARDYVPWRGSDIWPNYPNGVGVPAYGINGQVFPNPGTGSFVRNFQARLDDELEEETPISMEITGSYEEDEVEIVVTMTSEEDIDDLLLRVAIVEKYNDYGIGGGYPAGHHNGLLEVYPDLDGESFDITAEEGTTLTFNTDLDVGWDDDMTEEDMIIVAWVEDEDKEFYQAAQAEVAQLLYPGIQITEMVFDDSQGDGDGRLEAGETCEVFLTIENRNGFQNATDVAVELTLDDETIEMITDGHSVGSMEDGDTFENSQEPLVFTLPEDYEARPVTATITITANDGAFELVQEHTMMYDWPPFLIIDASEDEEAIDAVYGNFDGEDLPWAERFDYYGVGVLEEGLMENYDNVLIHTFNSNDVSWFDYEVSLLRDYLDNGGNLIIASPFFCIMESMEDFMHDYLGAELNEEETQAYEMLGTNANHPFKDAYYFFSGRGSLDNPDLSPSLNPVNGGRAVINWVEVSDVKGVSAISNVTDTYSTLLCAFSPEMMGQAQGGEKREDFLARLWEWVDYALDAPVDAKPVVHTFALNAAYPNPFNSQTVIPFSLDVAGDVSIVLYDVNGREVGKLINDKLEAGVHNVSVDAGALNLSNGTYIVKLTNGDRSLSSKVLFMK